MLIVERQARVLELVRQRGAAQLDELAREMGVSVSTIRRDFEHWESRGRLRRTHGGAVYVGEAPPGSSGESALAAASRGPLGAMPLALNARMNDHVSQKRAIARAVDRMVRPQMTVLMDGGSTVIYAAREISARPIQVVTNSLSIANLYADDDAVELLLIGGNLYPRTGVTVGSLAVGSLAELHADLLLFSLAGIYDDAAYNINLTMAEVEQAMMRQAVRSVLLMDSSKFGLKSLARVCGLDELERIITDDGVDAAWRDRLGDRLVVASEAAR